MVNKVFEPTDRAWRGIGIIAGSGWRLRPQFERYDAEKRYSVREMAVCESPLCRSGQVLQGHLKPSQCPAFGKECTPRTPLGATMVSSEGACAAYFQHRRFVAQAVGHP